MKRRSKYGAEAVVWGGRRYASRVEADRGADLQVLERAGEITDLRYQRVITLAGAVTYRPDFDYLERGRRVYEDVKGFEGERWRVILALWPLWGPGVLRIVKRDGRRGGLRVDREVLPKLQARDAFCQAQLTHRED